MKDTLDNGYDIDDIIINAQLLALFQVRNKIQDKIDELEKKKEDKNEIPF
jgi:hypothetical protein